MLNNRLLAKLAMPSRFVGEAEHRTAVYMQVHEDSSTASTPKAAGRVEFCKKSNIAFVMSPRLGDSLLAMIVVHNLRRNGYVVTVFSNHLYALRTWFPQDDIRPYPEETSGQAILQTFSALIHTYPHDVLYQADQWHPCVIVLDNHALHRRCISMVDLQVAVCQELFGLTQVVRTNGLTPPSDVKPRSHLQRIAIHPTASLKGKQWLSTHFIKLAHKLQQQGYTPHFIISPTEKSDVPWIEQHQLPMVGHASLDTVARWLCESGWFIGNDSGIGHLASNLGLPTITLMPRKKTKIRWRPNWAPGIALLPWFPLIVRTWKERYWKYFISPRRVLAAFRTLTREA